MVMMLAVAIMTALIVRMLMIIVPSQTSVGMGVMKRIVATAFVLVNYEDRRGLRGQADRENGQAEQNTKQ